MARLLALVLLVASTVSSAWVLPVPHGHTVLAAADDFLLTGYLGGWDGAMPFATAYDLTTQKVLWNNTQLCHTGGSVAQDFLAIQPGVLRYICTVPEASGSYVESSFTLDLAKGTAQNGTYLTSEAVTLYGGLAIANAVTGLYCLPVWPARCIFRDGSVLAYLPALSYDTVAQHYFDGTTYVVVRDEEVVFFDATTGTFLGAIDQFCPEHTEASPFAAFVDDLVVLTFVLAKTDSAYAVVINITQRAVTAQAQLGSTGITGGKFLAPPVVVATRPGADRPSSSSSSTVLVGLPVYEGNEGTPANCTLRVWNVPTANETVANASLSSVPALPMATVASLVSPTLFSEYYIDGVDCAPVGEAFLACSVHAISPFTEANYALGATTLLDAKTLSVVSNLTNQPSALEGITRTGRVGNMLLVAGLQSGGQTLTPHGQYRGHAGVVAFDSTTGALLWDGPYALIDGHSMAFDALHECVVVARAVLPNAVVCINATGAV